MPGVRRLPGHGAPALGAHTAQGASQPHSAPDLSAQALNQSAAFVKLLEATNTELTAVEVSVAPAEEVCRPLDESERMRRAAVEESDNGVIWRRVSVEVSAARPRAKQRRRACSCPQTDTSPKDKMTVRWTRDCVSPEPSRMRLHQQARNLESLRFLFRGLINRSMFFIRLLFAFIVSMQARMKDIVSRGESECMPTHDVQSPMLRAMHPEFPMTSPMIRSGNPAYPVFPLSRTMDHASPVTRSSNPASQVPPYAPRFQALNNPTQISRPSTAQHSRNSLVQIPFRTTVCKCEQET